MSADGNHAAQLGQLAVLRKARQPGFQKLEYRFLKRRNGYDDESYSLADIDVDAIDFIQQFGPDPEPKSEVVIANTIKLSTLQSLVKWYDREVAVVRNLGTGLVVMGIRQSQTDMTKGGGASPPDHAIMLLHVHPSNKHVIDHFEKDQKASSLQEPHYKEAVMNLGSEIVVIEAGKILNAHDAEDSNAFTPPTKEQMPSFILQGEQGIVVRPLIIDENMQAAVNHRNGIAPPAAVAEAANHQD